MVFGLFQQALGAQLFDDQLTGFVSIQAVEIRWNQIAMLIIQADDGGINGEDIDQAAVCLGRDRGLVAAVVGPAATSRRDDQAGVDEQLQVSGCRRLADPELVDDELVAGAVLDRVAVLLGWEVRRNVLEPLEDLEAPFARHGSHDQFEVGEIAEEASEEAASPAPDETAAAVSDAPISPAARHSSSGIKVKCTLDTSV
mgnify:CR=1 FL=1